MKKFFLIFLKTFMIILFIGLTIYSFIPENMRAEKEPCVRCSEVGCSGGTVLCAQFVCRGTLVQCFTSQSYSR